MTTIYNPQTQFFEQLKNKLSPTSVIANELAGTLGISKSEAYSKLNGKSSLTLTQIELLCNKYNLNFEIRPALQSNTTLVKFTLFQNGEVSLGQYLEILSKQMQQVASKGLKNLTCSTDDVPFFHFFKYKELTAFKLHFWNSRIQAQRKNKPEQIFDYKNADKKSLKNAYNLWATYMQMPCTEIWTSSDALIIIDQLKYAIESKLIPDKKMQHVICNQLLKVFEDIEKYARDGYKTPEKKAAYNWYACELVGNVSYLAEREDMSVCFLRFNTFNSFESYDKNICKEVRLWLDALLNDSVGFTGHGSKHRNIYLASVRRQIEIIGNS